MRRLVVSLAVGVLSWLLAPGSWRWVGKGPNRVPSLACPSGQEPRWGPELGPGVSRSDAVPPPGPIPVLEREREDLFWSARGRKSQERERSDTGRAATADRDRFARRAAVAIADGDDFRAIPALRAILHARPRDVTASRDLVWALGRAGRDREAAAFLAARPWLYRASPGDELTGGLHPAGMTAGKLAEPPFLAAARAAVRSRPRDAAAHAA